MRKAPTKIHIGLKIGSLTFVRRLEKAAGKEGYYWELKCDCGNTIKRLPKYATDKRARKHCGCLGGRRKYYEGYKIEKLTLVKKLDKKGYWEAKCECGNVVKILPHNVSKSCGCVKRDKLAKFSAFISKKKQPPVIQNDIPEWMNNPALLPKKPPIRKVEE